MKCIIKLETGVWLADQEGDPGRTLIRSFAKVFNTRKSAKNFLRKSKDTFPNWDFSNAEIEGKDNLSCMSYYSGLCE